MRPAAALPGRIVGRAPPTVEPRLPVSSSGAALL